MSSDGGDSRFDALDDVSGNSSQSSSDQTGAASSREQPDSREKTDQKSEPVDIDDPAFDFDDSSQTPFYPRSETREDFEDAVALDIERRLRREHGIKNSTKREIHDAVLRLAVGNTDEVADLIADERR